MTNPDLRLCTESASKQRKMLENLRSSSAIPVSRLYGLLNFLFCVRSQAISFNESIIDCNEGLPLGSAGASIVSAR